VASWQKIRAGVLQTADAGELPARAINLSLPQKSILKNLKTCMDDTCVFCLRNVPTRGHHVVPRCKGGREIAPTCHSCEDFIHKTWTHNELRDEFNTVAAIRADTRFQKFLRWLYKQKTETVFKSRRSRSRDNHKYR